MVGGSIHLRAPSSNAPNNQRKNPPAIRQRRKGRRNRFQTVVFFGASGVEATFQNTRGVKIAALTDLARKHFREAVYGLQPTVHSFPFPFSNFQSPVFNWGLLSVVSPPGISMLNSAVMDGVVGTVAIRRPANSRGKSAISGYKIEPLPRSIRVPRCRPPTHPHVKVPHLIRCSGVVFLNPVIIFHRFNGRSGVQLSPGEIPLCVNARA